MVAATFCSFNINLMAKVLLLLLLSTWTRGCEYEKQEIANCTGRRLSTIPHYFDENLKTLIVSKNRINSLDSFSLQKYPKIEILQIDNNYIETREDLRNVSLLKELRCIDISSNFLDVMDFTIFYNNKRLEIIIANSNSRLEICNSSEELLYLHRIELRNCMLTNIPTKAFQGFPNLKIIDLRDNKLTHLLNDPVLPNLQHLLIANNPDIHIDPELRLKSDLANNTMENKSTSIVTSKGDGSTSPSTNLIQEAATTTKKESVIGIPTGPMEYKTARSPAIVIGKNDTSTSPSTNSNKKSGNTEVAQTASTEYTGIIITVTVTQTIVIIGITVIAILVYKYCIRQNVEESIDPVVQYDPVSQNIEMSV